jgi:hypothetical protein
MDGIEQDAVGGPTRLSYAQVAQHHKEKVERMLREKQNTEQEKEKEKERKKDGSTSRVVQHQQQHGDVRGWLVKSMLINCAVWNLQTTLITMSALVTLVEGQRSDSDEQAGIVMLCIHFLT